MNKRKLQEFATWSKLNLEKQIQISLKKIGIHSAIKINQSRVRAMLPLLMVLKKLLLKDSKE
jgi:hypothetical protein